MLLIVVACMPARPPALHSAILPGAKSRLDGDDEYWKLAQAYFGHAGRARDCLAQQQARGWAEIGTKPTLLTLGVEGSGHHLIESMSPAICQPPRSQRGCGGQASYPSLMQWRTTGELDETRDFPVRTLMKDMLDAGSESRFLVLTRDPLAAKMSALLRFGASPTATAFELEAKAMVQSLSLLAEDVEQLPCDRTLFVGYELLTAFPQEHRGALAAFLGVPANAAALDHFLDSIKPCPICAKIAERWSQTGTLSAEVTNCSEATSGDGALKLGQRLVSVTPEQRLARDGAPCSDADRCQEDALRILSDLLTPLAQESRTESALMPTLDVETNGVPACYVLNIMRELAIRKPSTGH